MVKTCAIVGSGIAGIATAIRLAKAGIKVDVYEANRTPGGKLREKRMAGYRFDMGPSVFTLPNLIDELFTLCGKDPRNYFEYTKLEKSFNYFFEDKSVLYAWSDAKRFADEIESKTRDSKEVFERYCKDIALKYDITNEVFIENSLHVPKNFWKKKVITGVLNFHKIEAFKTMDAGNRQYFKDPRLIQLFNNFATYVGSNPMMAPATMNVIQHLEINIGAFMPDKGMYSLVKAMVKLAEEMGVTFHLHTRVKEIVVNRGDVIGICLEKDNETKRYDSVVSNMDVFYTYKHLLPNQKKPKLTLSQPKSCSVIGFYWGIKKKFKPLGVHNMLFSGDEKEEYEAIFERHTLPVDPSLYICITSKHVKSDAPDYGENWFVLINSPYDNGQDWDKLIEEARIKAQKKINRILDTNIEELIEVEEILTPPMIERKYSSAFGSIYGNSSNGKFSAFLRHPNFSRKINNLYFVGGSVHPGAGLPMCLNSAKIVSKVFKT